MAGGYHAFGAGDVLTATNVDTYLMKQTVMPFATTTARDAALTSPTEGMMASTADRDIIWLYDGSAWQRVGSYSASGRTGCFVSRAANQSISASTLTTITFDTANTDNDSFHSGATFNQVTVPSGLGGIYAINARAVWAATPASSSQVIISTGGFDYESAPPATASSQSNNYSANLIIAVAASASVAVKVYQATAGAVNVTVFMDMWRLMI